MIYYKSYIQGIVDSIVSILDSIGIQKNSINEKTSVANVLKEDMVGDYSKLPMGIIIPVKGNIETVFTKTEIGHEVGDIVDQVYVNIVDKGYNRVYFWRDQFLKAIRPTANIDDCTTAHITIDNFSYHSLEAIKNDIRCVAFKLNYLYTFYYENKNIKIISNPIIELDKLYLKYDDISLEDITLED